MLLSTRARILPGLLLAFATAAANSTELPANFPSDVPIADYMQVTGVTVVRDSMMVYLQAPDRTIGDVVAWFRSGLGANGWESEGDTESERMAILAYSKQGRRCGVSVTNFVMNEAMQRDDSIKGITLQLAGAPKSREDAAEEASEAASDMSASD